MRRPRPVAGLLPIALFAALLALASLNAVAAEDTPGISPETILFGQSAALSGPAVELGTGMRLGVLAAFREVNETGGVHGRRLELLTYDDRYEPESA